MSGKFFPCFLLAITFFYDSCTSEIKPDRFVKTVKILRDSCHVQLAENINCLPYPSLNFISKKAHGDFERWRENTGNFAKDIVYFYLVMHLDSINEKKVLETDAFWGPVEWKQSFENGVEYSHLDYVEVGGSGKLYTRCKDKTEFLRILAPVIEISSPDESRHIWKRDSTLYEPQRQEAGCYYEIKCTSDRCYYLTWYCGC